MGLEAGTFINDLNASNPVGASDPKSQGDDHIRLIKSTILATFAGITGAVTATHTQLNQLASLAAVSVLGRSANSAGAPAAIAAAANDRILRRVSDVVDFGQLTAGMFPANVVADAALRQGAAVSVIGRSANSVGNVADIVAASNDQVLRRTGDAVSFGAVPDGALSSNVPLKNASNVFTSSGVSTPAIEAESAIPVIAWEESDAVSGARHWDIAVNGGVWQHRATADDGTGANTWFRATRGAGTTISGVQIDATTLTLNASLSTPNTAADEVGYKGSPHNTQNGDYTLVLSDAGKCIRKSSGGAGETITIPANASVPFPDGTIIIIHNGGGGTLSIAITSDTLTELGTGNTGTRTLANNGKAILEKFSPTIWKISGIGLS